MRRRQFVASGVAVLAALSGCLGDDSQDTGGAAEPSRKVDWEPTPTSANDAGENENEGSSGGSDDSGDRMNESSEGRTGNAASDESDESETNGAFDEGATWEAKRVQVAADARKAGAAVEFELETTPPEPCGRTCRELRAALTNAGTGNAHDVVVDTELTSAGNVLRERREVIGDLPSGETYRATERVELDAIEAVQVQRNGTLTVEHVVTSAERREVFRERIEP